ncbi:MAG: hypothetical protein PHW10_03920 [Candidatus Peribacteraceae bacterium]|nr:hypothetical protein [Candidatus Peribacteraceae bacterium]
MRILFVSRDLKAANLACVLKSEGCDVKLFIADEFQRPNFQNLVHKTPDWEKELPWVGKNGLIVFDDIGYGAVQERLRSEGYSVFGGSKLGDRLEEDREWSQEIFKKYGLKSPCTINFSNIKAAISFLHQKQGPWVIKQNGCLPKDINYVGHFKDNRDAISVLENYNRHNSDNLRMITLQKRVYGVEVGVARYFNGDDWVGPIEINVEHKKLFPGDLGPTTAEMGTLAWYTDKSNYLFDTTLAKIKPFLREIDFRGDIDIGCIANERGIYPLEATPRLGTPIIHLHREFHASPWHHFLKAVADKKPFRLKWKKGYGIVVLISLPPFPYNRQIREPSPLGIEVHFDPSLTKDDYMHIHFEGISLEQLKNNGKKYYISDPFGYALYVTGLGKTISQARRKTNKLIEKICIPKMFYRNDIGSSFEATGKEMLERWGYL